MSDTTVEFSPAATPLAEKLLEPALEIIARYPAGRSRSALLPLLHLVQTVEGHVSPAGVSFCAEILGINKAQVGAVATFYTMYKRRPTGEYLVSVCTNTLCNVLGGQQVYDELSEHLGVGHDETTADGRITLEHAECLAACDYAPVVTVNYDFAIDEATPESTIGLVEQLRKGERPTLGRGARICSLKEMQVQLAGFADERDGAVADGPAGAPTLRGVTLAQEHGVSVPNFNLDTPITTTKPARDDSAKAVKDAEPATSPLIKTPPATAEPSDGLLATAAKKAAGAVRAAAETVTGHTAKPGTSGQVKHPEVRTAEQRHGPDAKSARKTPTRGAATGANRPASDGKPAGDDARPAAASDAAASDVEEKK